MRIFVGLYLVGLALGSPAPQFGGFFQGIANVFRGRGGRNIGGSRPGGGGGRGCGGGHAPNHQFGGQNFLVSWRLGCTSFTQGEGEGFCRANGMRPISIDNSAKEREFTSLVAREGQKYFWTGGRMSGGRLSWPSGRFYDQVNWSHTGGWVHAYHSFAFKVTRHLPSKQLT